MLIVSVIVLYVAIGVLSGFCAEPYWYVRVGSPTRTMHGYGMGKIIKARRKDSIVLAALISGVLWPIAPIVYSGMYLRRKVTNRIEAKEEYRRELEAAMKDL